jgi:hypothetical protein
LARSTKKERERVNVSPAPFRLETGHKEKEMNQTDLGEEIAAATHFCWGNSSEGRNHSVGDSAE